MAIARKSLAWNASRRTAAGRTRPGTHGDPTVSIRRVLAAALALSLTAASGTAAAAVFYVAPGGSDGGAGTLASPWSLSRANTSLLAGDVAILAPGNYGTARIAPANSGSSYSRFIAYVGSLADPASTTVGGISFGTRSYVSVKGVRFAGDVVFTAPRDSLAWCVSSAGDLNAVLGGDDCVAAHCTFNGQTMGLAGGTNGASPSFLYRDSLIDCRFNLVHDEGGMAALAISTTYQLYVSRCRFFITVTPTGNNGMVKMYGPRRSKFVDCLFDLTSNRPLAGSDECNWTYFRDYFMFNHFLRDTFLVHGSQVTDLLLTASGSYPGTTRGNKYEACVFRQSAPATWAALRFQDGARADTLVGCTVVAGSMPALEFYGLGDSCLFRNNTLVTLGGQRVIRSDWGSGHTWVGRAGFSDNIFYAAPSAGDVTFSLGNEISERHWTGGYNLYYCRNAAATSVQVWNVGLMGPGAAGGLCTSYGTDCTSRYGDPLFVGGAGALAFDVGLRSGSPAIGAGTGGGDIGARPFAVVADLTPPAAVTDLAGALVGDDSVVLTWTAPGDDGGSGQAAAYSLRVSTAVITAENFDGAAAVAGVPAPQAAGAAERFTVGGLASGTTYFFAVKALDEAANPSPFGNVLSATTAVADTVPPARIGDLRAD